MSEGMKDLAKRFFLLLHVFLERRYKRVDLVFIRHTEVAEEGAEEIFFHRPAHGRDDRVHSPGGTDPHPTRTLPGGLVEYLCAQASDGDNLRQRHPSARWRCWKTTSCRSCSTSPISRSRSPAAIIRGETDLWRGYAPLAERVPKLAMRRVAERKDIFPVFRDLFGRKVAQAIGRV